MNSNKYNIHIAGFKHNVSNFNDLFSQINEIKNGCTLQILNADGIAGKEHALHSAVQALKAFQREENIANDLGLEICLRASAQRQISKALDILGIKNGQMNICVVAIDCSKDIIEKMDKILDKRDDKVLNPNLDVINNIYKLSKTEIDAAGSVTDLMIEKTTLLILDT